MDFRATLRQRGQGLADGLPRCSGNGIAQATLVPVIHSRRAHPGGKPGPGQGHVEFADVLAQALLVGLFDVFRRWVEHRHQLDAVVVVANIRLLRVLGPEGGAEGQEHQWIFQALGFVHGDHLHQPGVAFQAQGAVFVLFIRCPQDLGKVVHQRVFAVQLQAVLLQKFRNVQNVSKPSLTVWALQQKTGHFEVHQKAAQHG